MSMSSAVPRCATFVRVNLGPDSYDILIGEGNLGSLTSLAAARFPTAKLFLVTDANVRHHAEVVGSLLRSRGNHAAVLEVPSGEQAKSVEHASYLWERLLASGADRGSLLLAVGGGVVGDLTGFVAATFARGIPFIQVPTTLLAQVDSSVGGKVGINLPAAKNMVGAFHQPLAVVIDLRVLDSLPDREYRAGLAEVVKYGVAMDAAFFKYLERHASGLVGRDLSVLTRVVTRSCRLKADVVERDVREVTGLRAILNYGHTFAHALETVCGYGTLLHGEAVAIGMTCAARLAKRLGRIDDALIDRQRALLEFLGLPVHMPGVDRSVVVETMLRDKKARFGQMVFVLPDRLGHAELVAGVPLTDVEAALADDY